MPDKQQHVNKPLASDLHSHVKLALSGTVCVCDALTKDDQCVHYVCKLHENQFVKPDLVDKKKIQN